MLCLQVVFKLWPVVVYLAYYVGGDFLIISQKGILIIMLAC